jgi:hypothetical protein
MSTIFARKYIYVCKIYNSSSKAACSLRKMMCLRFLKSEKLYLECKIHPNFQFKICEKRCILILKQYSIFPLKHIALLKDHSDIS